MFIPNCLHSLPSYLEEQEQAEGIRESLEAEQIDEDHGGQADVGGDREAECAWRGGDYWLIIDLVLIYYRMIIDWLLLAESTVKKR